MKTFKYQIHFTTPAFLGNAEQSGQWRTPPFKALLRQWWRVVYAADHGHQVDVAAMRREEGLLFGHAWLDDDRDENLRLIAARKSMLRIRLSDWSLGKVVSWNGLERESVFHPEAEKVRYKVGPQAYLGYGPLDGRGGTRFSAKVNAAIQAGESAELSIAVSTNSRDQRLREILLNNESRLEAACALINLYGTVGGRSRNGWGSFWLESTVAPLGQDRTLARQPLLAWQACLKRDWPHAIGTDEKPLVWQTSACSDWRQVMHQLAVVKICLRTQFVFPDSKPPHAQPMERHWLSYPITHHGTKAWKRDARLPNSLRFKVRPAADDPKKLVGVIFHVPCSPPSEFKPNPAAIESTWRQVHELLDDLQTGSKRTYAMIGDKARRDALKAQLDTITLERIPE